MSEELKLDKSDWTPVTFGDVVAEVRNSTKDPVGDGIKRVVGLEHIEPECIHLRSWASIEDDTTFTKVFRKGHVLFGRRRAYLKKASLADFDGICSGDITVMEAKDGLIPKLLPFLVNNDKFFDYAVQHSAGGLSPRTKFKDIANYEFLLPPKDQQAKLAELLWAADDAVQAEETLLQRAESLLDSELRQVYEPLKRAPEKLGDFRETDLGWIPQNWEFEPQGNVANFINGRAYKKTEWESSGVPVIRLQNLTGSGEEFYYSNLDLPEKNYCHEGDLLYMWSATFGAHLWKGSKAIFHYHIWKIECDESKIMKMFMFYNLEEITKRMMRQVSGGVMPHITKSGMEKLCIPLPPISEQITAVETLDRISNQVREIASKKRTTRSLQKSLINQIF